MFRFYKLFTVLYLFITITKGFNLFVADKKMPKFIYMNSINSPYSYLNLLQQAQAVKQLEQTHVQRPPANSPHVPSSTSLNNVVSQTNPEDAADNGLPFSDELYEHLKYIIGKITSRIKYGAPLKSEELSRFEFSAAAIIADAKKTVGVAALSSLPHDVHLDSVTTYTVPPPECPASQTMPQYASGLAVTSPVSFSVAASQIAADGRVQTKETDVFSPLYGMKSTWQIPGMESMTTAEYYDAINRRNSEIKAMMKARPDYDRNPGASYLESLEKKN